MPKSDAKAAASPQLIVALDNCTVDEALALVGELSAAGVEWFKVGLELYTQAGPSFVSELKKSGRRVFLDLKLHDIPNTVAKAVRAAVGTGADLLTVHASGGPAMLEAACEESEGSTLSVVAVTVLTSLGGPDFARISEAWGARQGAAVPRGAVALRLAEMAAAAGLPGIVCSVSDLHDGQLGKLGWRRRPIFVTPGIRNSGDAVNDQKSVATVEQALLAGATHLVAGRPITAPATGSRADAAREFLKRLGRAAGGSGCHRG